MAYNTEPNDIPPFLPTLPLQSGYTEVRSSLVTIEAKKTEKDTISGNFRDMNVFVEGLVE